MRRVFLFLIFCFLCLTFSGFSDETSDKFDTSKFKFRGNAEFVLNYMTEYQDGIRTSNHYLPVSYDKLDYTDPDSVNHSEGDPGRVVGGGWGGIQAKLYLNYSFIMPLLQFDNFLMSDNNIKFTVKSEVSPVTMNGGFSVTFTPLAFLVLSTGFLIGPGWKIADDIAGIGINRDGIIDRKDFAGPLFQQWFSVTFQMDFAYVVPEKFRKWMHIVLLGTTTVKYQALLGLDPNQPYMYEECPGEHLGGWRLIADFLLGYRIFILEDPDTDKGMFIKHNSRNLVVTFGFFGWLDYLDLSHYKKSPMSKGWGSDFAFFNFGPAVQVDLPFNVYVKFFAFFRNDRVYTDETVGNRYYQDRVYADYNVFFRWFGGFVGVNF